MNPNEEEQSGTDYTDVANDLRQRTKIDQYVNEENSRLEDQKLKKLSEFKNNTGGPVAPELNFATFTLMFGVAGFFDLIKLGINIVPIVGGAIGAITITPLGILTFWFWTKAKGISMTKGIRGPVTAILMTMSFIPVVDALPEFTGEIIMLKATMMLEKKVKAITGVKKTNEK